MTTQPTYRHQSPGRDTALERGHPWAEPFVFTDRLAEALDQLRVAVTPRAAKFPPGAELIESDTAFVLDVDLPRVTRDDVSVEVSDRRVEVRGRRPEPERPGLLRHSTREVGEFAYEIALPGDVDPGRSTARLQDGILTVTLPRIHDTRGATLAVE